MLFSSNSLYLVINSFNINLILYFSLYILIFEASTCDISNISLGDLPNPEEIHNHITSMMEGKLGKLAREIAEETVRLPEGWAVVDVDKAAEAELPPDQRED